MKIKNGIIKIFDKHSDKYPMDLMAEEEKYFRESLKSEKEMKYWICKTV